MKLDAYIELANITVGDFAKSVDVTPNAVKYWISGERTPRPEQMRKVMAATNGAVTPNDFVQGAESVSSAAP